MVYNNAVYIEPPTQSHLRIDTMVTKSVSLFAFPLFMYTNGRYFRMGCPVQQRFQRCTHVLNTKWDNEQYYSGKESHAQRRFHIHLMVDSSFLSFSIKMAWVNWLNVTICSFHIRNIWKLVWMTGNTSKQSIIRHRQWCIIIHKYVSSAIFWERRRRQQLLWLGLYVLGSFIIISLTKKNCRHEEGVYATRSRYMSWICKSIFDYKV